MTCAVPRPGYPLDPAITALAVAVRANCDLSDARHAQDLTLCNYLLAMREYYRWESGLPPEAVPARADVGRWIAEREARWASLDGADWAPLPLAAGSTDPFDADAVNAELVPSGFLYGAGRGRFGKPHFFLARLARRERRDGTEILEAGHEYVRDIEAAPALLQGGTVVIRRDAFERWLWLQVEAWQGKPADGDLAAALEAYGYARGAGEAIARLAESERETLVLHELGERECDRLLGAPWDAFMAGIADRRLEISARAVRDLLADCRVTLPALLDRGHAASLHFWFATFGGLRRELFPRLLAAREHWRREGGTAALREAAEAGYEHWLRVARDMANDEASARRWAREPQAIALA